MVLVHLTMMSIIVLNQYWDEAFLLTNHHNPMGRGSGNSKVGGAHNAVAIRILCYTTNECTIATNGSRHGEGECETILDRTPHTKGAWSGARLTLS